MVEKTIKFNEPFISEKEQKYVAQALARGELAGDKSFTHKCQQLMQQRFGAQRVLLTTSCTSALEMAAILCDIQAGDEVIMPSFTFVSTANAFLLRGAKLKFIDIRPDTLNMDESKIIEAITTRTKAIVPVHYGSTICEMNEINRIAKAYGLYVIEDAAQAVDTAYHGKYAGTIGDAGAYSFHETKNFVAGEAGALVINREDWLERAEVIREKGTNRSQFFRGQVDKYTWVDIGSSYVPSDLLAALLFGQLESMESITSKRALLADAYLTGLASIIEAEKVKLPVLPEHCSNNHHMFPLICQSEAIRNELLEYLELNQVKATFHYMPLHNSPYAKQQGFYQGPLPITERVSSTLIRLPMHPNLTVNDVAHITKLITCFYDAPHS
ncbi:dTDP-4-amino-4,6-dideoxygalactose transaminase [Thalassotalea montiporae]